MLPKKISYGIWHALYPLVNTAICVMLLYYNHKREGRATFDEKFLAPQWFVAFLIILPFFIIYHCYKYLMPMLLMKSAIELDSEKINVRLKHKIVYWNDVKEITVNDLFNIAVIKLNNKKKVRIFLNCVRGNNYDVYETILSYYKRATDTIV
jgi:hypothetical protein